MTVIILWVSKVIVVVLGVVSIALKLYNVNDFKHPTVCIAQLDFLTLMCVFNCAAGKSSWQSWRFYLLCPWQKEYNWQSAWGDDLLKLHSENFRKLSTASIKSLSVMYIVHNTFSEWITFKVATAAQFWFSKPRIQAVLKTLELKNTKKYF